MKKFQLIFVAVAILTAAAGVFANTLNTTIDWKRLSTGNLCTGTIASPPQPCNFTSPNPCFVDEVVGEEIKRFYFDMEVLNDQGQRIACLTYKKP